MVSENEMVVPLIIIGFPDIHRLLQLPRPWVSHDTTYTLQISRSEGHEPALWKTRRGRVGASTLAREPAGVRARWSAPTPSAIVYMSARSRKEQ